MDAEWKWLCYEWQGRGSIHAHGCAKLKNDPGLFDLVKTAAHGLKLQKVLDVEQDEPNYEEMGHDFTPAIEAGVQAQARNIQYADWLPTTMNDSLPEENWTVPNPHPCGKHLQEAANEDARCSAAYCLRMKPGQLPQCRFNYPKDCTEQRSIQFSKRNNEGQEEPTVQEISEARVKASLITKRNDFRISLHNHVMLQYWRANIDLQAIVDTDQCIRYMAKYTTKSEPRSQPASEILNTAIRRLRHTDAASSALRRAMIQVAEECDIGSQFTAHMLLGLMYLQFPLHFTEWKAKSSCQARRRK